MNETKFINMEAQLWTTTLLAFFLLSRDFKHLISTASHITLLNFTTSLVENKTILNSIFHKDYQSHQSHRFTITNLNQMFDPFQDGNCLIHITSYQNVDIHPESNFPRMLRQLKISLLTRYLKYNFFSSHAASVPYTTLLWVPNTVGKFKSYQTKNSASTCRHSKYFRMSISTQLQDQPSLCTQLLYDTFPLNSRPWNCQVEVLLFPPVFSKLSERFSLQQLKIDPSILAFPSVWNFGGRFRNIENIFPSKIPIFTAVLTTSSLFNFMKHKDAFLLTFATFFRTKLGQPANPLERSTTLLMNKVFLVFESERNPCASCTSVYTRHNNIIIKYANVLLPNTRHLSVSIMVRVPYKTWLLRFKALRHVITAGYFENSNWEIKVTDPFEFFKNLEMLMRNCKRKPKSFTRQILNLPTAEHREACSIALLWNSLCKNESQCGYNKGMEKTKIGAGATLILKFTGSIRAQDSHFPDQVPKFNIHHEPCQLWGTGDEQTGI